MTPVATGLGPSRPRRVQRIGTTQYHLVPLADRRAHDHSVTCGCQPRRERVEGTDAILVIHHAVDGEAHIEAHGRP